MFKPASEDHGNFLSFDLPCTLNIPSNVDAGILVTPNEKQHVVHYHTPAPFWFVLSRVQLPTLNSKDDQIWDSKDIRCFRKQAACLLSFHSKASILPDIVQRCYHTQN